MGLRLVTRRTEIKNAIDTSVDEWLKGLLDRLVLLGDACYEYQISRLTYTHRTGNLGSSTGYLVLRDGQVYSEGGFLAITGPERTDKDPDGTLLGREFAESLIPEYSKGFVLLFVSGMNYASYVEAKGYDVLTSAQLWAERQAIDILNSMR